METCAAEKICVVPHGAPVVLGRSRPTGSPSRERERLSAPLRPLHLRLDLARQGLETAIAAMPAIVERHPEVLYVIAGRTHPEVARRDGEHYRLLLERRVVDLGVGSRRVRRSLPRPERARRPAPRHRRVRHAVSRTPSRSPPARSPSPSQPAVLPSRPRTSTRRTSSRPAPASWCRSTIRSDRRGRLRVHRESEVARGGPSGGQSDRRGPRVALGRGGTEVVLREAALAQPRRGADPDRRARAHLRSHGSSADTGGRRRDHPARERRHPELGDRVLRRRRRQARGGRARAHRARAESGLDTHPSPFARLPPVRRRSTRNRMRNFMGLRPPLARRAAPRETTSAAPIWALGEILSTAWIPALSGPSQRMLDALVPSLAGAVSLRTAAYPSSASVASTRIVWSPSAAAPRASRRPARHRVSRLGVGGWLWFEDRLTYDNARLPRADRRRTRLRRPDDVALGLESPCLARRRVRSRRRCPRLPGHQGRDRDEPAPGAGDEQPLDAAALVEAELAALAVTGDPEHGSRARSSYDWFLGRNKLDRPLYDFATGGCSDGLGESDLNANEGAESTLAFHRATLMLDAAALPAVTRRRKPRAKVA